MASACAMAIFSGKIIIHFGIAERLRTLRYSLFTEGVVKGNGICSACFLRKRRHCGKCAITFHEPSPNKHLLFTARLFLKETSAVTAGFLYSPTCEEVIPKSPQTFRNNK